MSRSSSLRCLLVVLVLHVVANNALCAERVELIVDGPLGIPAENALADLQQALEARSIKVTRSKLGSHSEAKRLYIGLAGNSENFDKRIKAQGLKLSLEPESLCIARIAQESNPSFLIAGSDTRGLSYALLEVARAIELTRPSASWIDATQASVETPFLRQRGVSIHLANRDLDATWYFDEAFWRDYFKTLATDRYNNFTLTFADQMNYLNPVYLHLLDVPGFDEVQAADATREDKARNLKMLKRITELADERGLDFTFAVWTQQPVENFGGPITVRNMPRGKRFADYCALGLAAVLKACPSIDAVQFRMNTESGISEEEQTSYYQSQFDAIRDCGHPVRLELRYKGLQSETIAQAIDTKLDLTVSTKFWCEHFGLPYHPTAEDTHYRESRYGYGAMLAKPRDYRVIYRLWTVGSHRLLLWADPNYAARFAESCRLGGGEGFDIFAPLTNKGYENAPGDWSIFADSAYKSYQWEQQRYWFYYLCFGRLCYNPECRPEVWRRELLHRFGPAAEPIEAAYIAASKINPLITATHLPSASEWRWWPEMDTGGPLEEYMLTPPSDTAQFASIRTWKQSKGWWREVWDEFPPGFVEESLDGKLSGRMTPVQVSEELKQLAQETLRDLEAASRLTSEKISPEFRATQLDLRIQAYLGLHHAEKKLAATHLGFFQATGDSGRLSPALAHMQQAHASWKRIAELTDGVYHSNLVFGHGPGSKRIRNGHHHGGHWKDRLPEVAADVSYLQELIKQHKPLTADYKKYPGETLPETRPRIEHKPVESTLAGKNLRILANVTSENRLNAVRLYYRRLDQTVDWQQMVMRHRGDSQFEATIPGNQISARWDLMYYLEAVDEQSAVLWPNWKERQPYIVVKVQSSD